MRGHRTCLSQKEHGLWEKPGEGPIVVGYWRLRRECRYSHLKKENGAKAARPCKSGETFCLAPGAHITTGNSVSHGFPGVVQRQQQRLETCGKSTLSGPTPDLLNGTLGWGPQQSGGNQPPGDPGES